MDAFFAALAVIGGTMLIFGAFQWIMAKYAGVRYHGKFQAVSAVREALHEESTLKALARKNPELVGNAIEQCKKKHYRLTPRNILTQANKLLRDEERGDASSHSSTRLGGIIRSLLTVKQDPIEDLYRLNELRKEGALSQEEFELLKQQILGQK